MAERTISVSELRSHVARILDDVARGKGPVTVTRRGKPVARITASEAEHGSIFGILRDTVTLHGGIVGPTAVEWNAED